MSLVGHGSCARADVGSAFKRIPIKPEDREFSHIAFRYNDQVLVARHLALMFGSIARLHHQERVGVLFSRRARSNMAVMHHVMRATSSRQLRGGYSFYRF